MPGMKGASSDPCWQELWNENKLNLSLGQT